MPRKALFSLFFVILLCSFYLSPAKAEDFGIWPLFSYYASEGEKELEIFGPIFTWEHDERGTEWGIRPFMYLTSHPSQELWRWEFLYPLGKYQRSEGDSKIYVVPLSLLRDEMTSSTPERRERASSFLTAFWGRTDEGERYGGFFPIAGRLKERFGRDKIAFYLWPLYSRIENEGEITWRTPWPLFSRFGGAAEGLYVWPLWGHKEREGEYKKGFVLWPGYAYIDEYLNTDNPVSKRFYLPLYATVRSPRGRVDIFIPPLFFHQWAYDSSFEKWEIPWPFVTLVKGEGVREWQIFPLFRMRDEEHKKRFYCLWPLYKYEWDIMEAEEEVVRRFLLINKYRIVKERKTGREALDTNLWPLFDYRRGLEGGVSFVIFPLLPLHDDGMERNIYPLSWVYRHTRSPQGATFTDLLWGLYRRRTSPGSSSTRFAFFLRIEKKGDKHVSLSFFEGLIRYQKKQDEGG
ncbi:MAG: hypothetical protein JXA50_05645 [Deltaproteobacteria bacterium]|nr:hypothetical protein [Deltaproteobacteria bacterium]